MSDDWPVVRLGDVASINPEKTPNWDQDKAIRYVDIASVSAEHGIISSSVRGVRWADAPGRARRRIREGDVLVSTVRPNLRAFATVPAGLDGEVASTGFAVLRASTNGVLPGFLWALVRSESFVADMVARCTGSNYPAVRASDVGGHEFALPPLPVQRRIVDLMEHLDNQVNLLRAEAGAVRATRVAAQARLVGFGSSDATCSLGDLIDRGEAEMFRGKVISKKTMAASPGPYPVYSSAQGNNGAIGHYGEYMFDEELITWSVDGGGHLFHRPRHRFSVTNIGGVLRVLDLGKWDYRFLFYSLDWQHGLETFDWQSKAHPSVIRTLYSRIPLVPLDQQQKIGDMLSAVDAATARLEDEAEALLTLRKGLLASLLSRDLEVLEAYDELLGVAA